MMLLTLIGHYIYVYWIKKSHMKLKTLQLFSFKLISSSTDKKA